MSAGNSASKSSTRTIPPAFSRNTISSPRRKISTSELLTRNFFGSLTAWLFPDLNTRAMAMICFPDIYTSMYIHLQAPIFELWAARTEVLQRATSPGTEWGSDEGSGEHEGQWQTVRREEVWNGMALSDRGSQTRFFSFVDTVSARKLRGNQ